MHTISIFVDQNDAKAEILFRVPDPPCKNLMKFSNDFRNLRTGLKTRLTALPTRK